MVRPKFYNFYLLIHYVLDYFIKKNKDVERS